MLKISKRFIDCVFLFINYVYSHTDELYCVRVRAFHG